MTDGPGRLARLADYVSLAYHEARNVRHLIRAGAVDGEPWKYLVALPTNRQAAWKAFHGIRELARRADDVASMLQPFERRFHISLADLVTVYANEAWRNSPYGGNAWAAIASRVLDAVTALQAGRIEEADGHLAALLAARHNTGRVVDKLQRLDHELAAGSSA